MSKSRIALTALLAFAALPSLAQTAAPAAAAAEPDWTLTGNLGIFSDYRFRGISQTNKNPAIQGGVDFAMKNGIYLGNWNSNVDSAQYTGANIEMDFYGGWKTTVEGFGIDIGAIYYYYPGSGNQNSYSGSFKVDNAELYIGGSWGPIALKYSYAVTDFFGVPGTKGAYYVALSGAHDFGNGFGVNASVGYQGGLKNGDPGYTSCVTEFDGKVACSITDYKLGGTYTIDGWVLGLAYVSTNRDLRGATDPNKNISNGTALVSVTKSF
jgi:uncharacterized protein (TIGR02001 family)